MSISSADPALIDWNNNYLSNTFNKLHSDNWLDGYRFIFERFGNNLVFDLGCGAGGNTFFLKSLGLTVISGDYAIEALRRVRSNVFCSQTILFDYRNDLPFKTGNAAVIVADLSVHYFNWNLTKKIVAGLADLLRFDGHLLCRVNSVRDFNHGAGQGNVVEPNFYERKGCFKRFFDKDDIDKLFCDWNVIVCKEYMMNRFEKPKIVWEVAAKKHE